MAVSERPATSLDGTGPQRSAFSTTSPEAARAFIAEAYCDNELRVAGDVERFHLEHTRWELGSARISTFANTQHLEVHAQPLGALYATRVLEASLVLDAGAGELVLGPGDTVLTAHPEQTFTSVAHGARTASVGVDLDALERVSDDAVPLDRTLAQLRYGRLHPANAAHWHSTVSYLTGALLADRDARSSDLLVRTSVNLLAASMLAAFSPVTDTTAIDRRDAHPVTVRRAMAFIEANADVALTVADIARATNVTPRALQLAFRRHLDTTPMAVLRQLRLRRAHEDLRDAAPDGAETVTGIATRWAFTGSRFTALYRREYGVAPSVTLRDGHLPTPDGHSAPN